MCVAVVAVLAAVDRYVIVQWQAASPVQEKTYTVPSKYENIRVQTTEEQEDGQRFLLNASWPVTENAVINADLSSRAAAFIAEYRDETATQKADIAAYVAEHGTDPVAAHVTYTQNFDVAFANDAYIAFSFDQYRSTGNTGSDTVFSLIYNRTTGDIVPFASLFSSPDYLDQLSRISRLKLHDKVVAEADAQTFDTGADRAAWIERFEEEFVDPGTTPVASNFKGAVIKGDGTLSISFDKYQVAPGYWGVVTIDIPLTDIAPLLTPSARTLFALASASSSAPTGISFRSSDTATSSVDCAIAKCIALTFDDGPSVYTDQLLDTLDAEHVKATFFVVGVAARVQQATLLREAKDGMEIGNHTWDHKDLRSLSTDAMKSEITKTADLVQKITGIRPYLVRPPYGALDVTVREAIDAPFVLWSVDPEDWKTRDAAHVASILETYARPGAILLSHDIYQTTVDAMPQVIDTLRKEGYTFVTVSQLFGGIPHLLPGVSYRNRASG